MKKKNVLFVVAAILMVVLFSGCADVSTVCPDPLDHVYGFWGGLWHGIVLPFSWIGSLFSDSIATYAVNNSGGWYDFGFALGVSLAFGGGSEAT